MKFAITGTSGLVGSHLTAYLRSRGHVVFRLIRPSRDSHTLEAQRDSIAWDPATGILQPHRLEEIECVIHLAGRSIAQARWSHVEKKRLTESRVQPTRILCDQLAALAGGNRSFLCASAVGYYGDRGDTVLDEDSSIGSGFLPELARDWEAAAQPLQVVGERVVHLRFSTILSRDGGALAKLLTPFRLGLGGPIGSGKQFWSWVAIDDVVQAIEWLALHPEQNGVFNVTSPEPLRNSDFSATLAKVLHRPAIFPVPSFLLRILLGEMADGALLASCRAVPHRLLDAGYSFSFPKLDTALEHILG